VLVLATIVAPAAGRERRSDDKLVVRHFRQTWDWRGNTVNRRTLVLFALVLLAVAFVVGATAYNYGVAQGVAHATQVSAGGADVQPWVGPHVWYGGPLGWGTWGPGFAFFGLLRLVLFVGLIALFVRWITRSRGHRRGWAESDPENFEAQHRRAHQETGATGTQ
jgi:hypothetical protein